MSLVPVIILTVGQCQKIGFYVKNISKQEATDKSLKWWANVNKKGFSHIFTNVVQSLIASSIIWMFWELSDKKKSNKSKVTITSKTVQSQSFLASVFFMMINVKVQRQTSLLVLSQKSKVTSKAAQRPSWRSFRASHCFPCWCWTTQPLPFHRLSP